MNNDQPILPLSIALCVREVLKDDPLSASILIASQTSFGQALLIASAVLSNKTSAKKSKLAAFLKYQFTQHNGMG